MVRQTIARRRQTYVVAGLASVQLWSDEKGTGFEGGASARQIWRRSERAPAVSLRSSREGGKLETDSQIVIETEWAKKRTLAWTEMGASSRALLAGRLRGEAAPVSDREQDGGDASRDETLTLY